MNNQKSGFLGNLSGLLLVSLLIAGPAIGAVSLNLKDGTNIKLYDNSYALVIGVSNYKEWPDLPGVKGDVKSVSKSLKKQGFKIIQVLDPTRNEFDAAVRDFIADYGQAENNRLLVYYAGHGHTHTTKRGRQLGYLVPIDAPLPHKGHGPFKRRAISMLEVEIYAKQMESKHALFMFDSCFSGSLFEITRAVPDIISSKVAKPVRQFITAGSGDQTVPDKSVFRAQFVSALDGGADMNTDGYITGTELAQYLENRVTNYTRRAQTPQYGKIRDPILDKGDFVFSVPGYWEKKRKAAAAKEDAKIKAMETSQAARNESAAAASKLSVELAYWDSIKNSSDPAAFNTYLSDYPNGKFAKLARVSITRINKDEARQSEELKRREADRQRDAEAARKRDQELAEQRRLLEELKKQKTQLAMVRPSGEATTQNQLFPMADKNTVAVVSLWVPKNRNKDWRKTTRKKARFFQSIVEGRFFPSDVTYELLNKGKVGKKLRFDNNGKKRRKICKSHRVDYVLSGILDDPQQGIRGKDRDVTFSLYRCSNSRARKLKFVPEDNPGDDFWGQSDMQDRVSNWLREMLLNESLT